MEKVAVHNVAAAARLASSMTKYANFVTAKASVLVAMGVA
jgi:hypothetical protein